MDEARCMCYLFELICLFSIGNSCGAFHRTTEYFWIKYDLGQKYYAPHDRGSNTSPPDHDSTFHVTETPALTTWPSVISPVKMYKYNFLQK